MKLFAKILENLIKWYMWYAGCVFQYIRLNIHVILKVLKLFKNPYDPIRASMLLFLYESYIK